MEFAILGPLRVQADGHELNLGGAKRQALVCLLVVRANGPVGSERLAGLEHPTFVRIVQQLTPNGGDRISAVAAALSA